MNDNGCEQEDAWFSHESGESDCDEEVGDWIDVDWIRWSHWIFDPWFTDDSESSDWCASDSDSDSDSDSVAEGSNGSASQGEMLNGFYVEDYYEFTPNN